MEFETIAVMGVATAFLSMTSATVAFMASPANWWVSALLALAAVVFLVYVALKARNRTAFV